ncbi:HD domain-containing protein [Neobacillus sp. PS3-34]|uniref:HD domain-containing protein n=1 Tax=Neobacillus sp. PS3-34 TaxID=3070678 RepID=UPI0027E175DE|nr:HD domain-containing protein [Neobacillus sp. PS3-34]WML48122.1 HD domain-containing protein [Neobacillus sp. PS3-34]
MRDVTLTQIFEHHIAQKFLNRSGIAHAVAVAYHAFHLAEEHNVDTDVAAKAGLLHDIGHFTWYKNGKWDYELYKKNDIHAIKGAERAHKLLIRLGENPIKAKEIALAILFHTDSFLPTNDIVRTPLQEVVKWADEKDEEEGGQHHYRKISVDRARNSLSRLDEMIDRKITQKNQKIN